MRKMDENPIEKDCGVYSEGRYAWILDNIEALDKPMYANGRLGIWNYGGKEDKSS